MADDEHAVRPGPVRWLGYALGRSLPPRHRTWVLYDTTTDTWILRHLARALVQLAVPVILVLTVVPGPFWIRGMAALGGVVMGLIFSFAYITETTEHRLVKAGYPAGTAAQARQQVTTARQAQESQRRHDAAARRAARYRSRSGR
jgi:hypothetical protein